MLRTIMSLLLLLASVRSAFGGSLAASGPRAFWEGVWAARVTEKASSYYQTQQGAAEYDWHYKARAEFTRGDTELYLTLLANNALLAMPDVEDYVVQQLLAVHPGQLPDGHPGALHVKISLDQRPNAYALSDGTLLVTTGLITEAQTEDELRAVLAHEVSHIYCDHRMEAKLAAESRAATAGFLSAFAGIVAAGVAGQSGDPAVRAQAVGIGLTTAVVVGALSSTTTEVLGFAYSRKQEKEADALAQGWLRAFGRDTLALGRVLLRLSAAGKTMGGREGTGLMDSHPGCKQRLAALGLTKMSSGDLDSSLLPAALAYDAHIAKMIAEQAELALLLGRNQDAYELSRRAIQSGWGDANAFLAQSIALRLLYSQADSLTSAERLVDVAERAGGDTTAIAVQRTLLDLRKGNEGGALETLDAWLASPRLAGWLGRDDDGLVRWARATRSQLKHRLR